MKNHPQPVRAVIKSWNITARPNQNLHLKLGQQAPTFGSILAYLETTAEKVLPLGIKLVCF